MNIALRNKLIAVLESLTYRELQSIVCRTRCKYLGGIGLNLNISKIKLIDTIIGNFDNQEFVDILIDMLEPITRIPIGCYREETEDNTCNKEENEMRYTGKIIYDYVGETVEGDDAEDFLINLAAHWFDEEGGIVEHFNRTLKPYGVTPQDSAEAIIQEMLSIGLLT